MRRLLNAINKRKILSLGVASMFMLLQMPLGLMVPQKVAAEELEAASIENSEQHTSETYEVSETEVGEDTGREEVKETETNLPEDTKPQNVKNSDKPATNVVSSQIVEMPVLQEIQTPVQDEMVWAGNGSENADPECELDESSYWHWILTPGGNNTLVSATLEVTYESGATTTSSGAFRGDGSGAMHFDVTRPGPDVVESATVTFTYVGDGDNFVLTISDSECRETEPRDLGSITIIKDAVPNDPQDFTFTASGEGTSNFTLDDDPSNNTQLNSKLFDELEAGTYSFTENEISGWDLIDISCDEEVSVNLSLSKVTIGLSESMHATCTFTNEKDETEDVKVTLCHATGSLTNPFVKITVSAAGAFNGHLGDGHQEGNDIIPPFEFNEQTYSQNWDAVGQAIYDNDCVRPVGGGNDVPKTPSPVGGGGGLVAPASTGAVLGLSTLANTGQSLATNMFISFAMIALTAAISFAKPKRRISRNTQASAYWTAAYTSAVAMLSKQAKERAVRVLSNLPSNSLMHSLVAELRRNRLAYL